MSPHTRWNKRAVVILAPKKVRLWICHTYKDIKSYSGVPHLTVTPALSLLGLEIAFTVGQIFAE